MTETVHMEEEGLEFSPGARSVIASFHDVHCMVYVEGKNDIPFWEGLLREHGHGGVQFKVETLKDWLPGSAKGKKELLKYLPNVTNGSISCTIIAMDRDFDELKGRLCHSPRVLYTYGYCIENSFYTPRSFAHFLGYSGEKAEQIECSYQAFHEFMGRFVPFLVVAQLRGRAHELPRAADFCSQLLTSKEVAEQLLKSCAAALAEQEEDIVSVGESIRTSARSTSHLIPGKCYYPWFIDLCKSTPGVCKTQSELSKEKLSAFCREHWFAHPDKETEEFSYYRNKVQAAEAAVQKTR